MEEKEKWTQWFKEFGFSTILRLHLTYPQVRIFNHNNLIHKITQEFYGSLLQPYKQEFYKANSKTTTQNVLMDKHLN